LDEGTTISSISRVIHENNETEEETSLKVETTGENPPEDGL